MKTSLLIAIIFCASIAADVRAEVFFRDNFTGGKSSRWSQRNDGDRPGAFRVQEGTYTLVSKDPFTTMPRTLVSSFGRQDYFVQADVKMRSTNSAYSAASLLSYYTDSNNFYEFALDAEHHYWMLQKVDKSGTALLARGPIPGARRFTFRMGLYYRDGNLRALIDGIMVADELDQQPLRPGGFGLSSQGAESRWDNVIVKDSNPQDFFYGIEAHTTDSAGKTKFNNVRLFVADQSGNTTAGVLVYRIRRDGLSYFVIHDPSGRFALRSGFLSEFQLLPTGEYRITVHPAGTLQTQHAYDVYQVDWLFDFVRRSARIASKGVTAELRTLRKVYLRNGAFQSEEGPVTDSLLAAAGVQAEINQIDYGKWEEFGNYTKFPTITGKASASNDLIRRAASVTPAPPGTRFSLYTLQLGTGNSSAALAWLVQEDPRAFLLVETAGLPSSLQKGGGSSVPFSLLNTGKTQELSRYRLFSPATAFREQQTSFLENAHFQISPQAGKSSPISRFRSRRIFRMESTSSRPFYSPINAGIDSCACTTATRSELPSWEVSLRRDASRQRSAGAERPI